MAVTGRGGTETGTGRGTVLFVSVSPREFEELHLSVSTFPPGNYNFFFPPSTTDTHHTCADFKGYWHENHNSKHKPG